MPELPDLEIYVERLRALAADRTVRRLAIANPFVLRTATPPLQSLEGRVVRDFRRLGKRIVVVTGAGPLVLVHLMIAGRLHWRPPGRKDPRGNVLARLELDHAAVILTEAGSKRRASIHLVDDEAALAAFDRGGLEVMEADSDAFAVALRKQNHTLKRALTDPRILSGIGNAYSDEILHRARMSPFRQTGQLGNDEIGRLFEATRAVLGEWTERLRSEAGDGFPDKVTAFRDGMAVHGKYRQPCPVCGKEVQRIAYADRETNYCAQCQTGGRPLADRALSRFLGKDWPKTLDELEERRGGAK
jgi:formamidopyrimidine-DNA glycosylase